MATISFNSGGAPGVYINERAGVAGSPAIASFSTVYMLVEVDPAVPTTPEFMPFNTPIPVTSTRQYVEKIGGVIPTEKLDLLSYQCVDSFFAQCYVGDLRVVRVGTPNNVLEVQFNPSGYKTNGQGASSTLQAGDVVYAQLLINGARLGEITSTGTWKGVPIEIPVDYIPGNQENNRIIAKAMRDAVSAAIAIDPNISASVIVRGEGMCTGETDECAFMYLAGRTFDAPVSCVPESIPGNGSFFVLTLNAYDVTPVNPSNDRIEEAVNDYTQCIRTAFVDAEEQGYLCAPIAFEKFDPADRAIVGNLMGAVCQEKKWMALVDAGAYNVTDILEYSGLQQLKPADAIIQGQQVLCVNTVYEWVGDDTNYDQLRYTALSGQALNPEVAVTQSQNLNLPENTFLSLKDDGIRQFVTPGPVPYDKPGLIFLSDDLAWPNNKPAGTPAVLTDCRGSDELAELDGQTVYVVPTFYNNTEKDNTGFVYFSATYADAITCSNYIEAVGGLDNITTLPPGALPLDIAVSGGLAEYVTGVTITDPGDGYVTPPAVTFNIPADPLGRAATGEATIDLTDGQINAVEFVGVNGAGQGYTNVPSVVISSTGGGVNATATATVANTDGRVADLNLLTQGAGYTAAPSVTISSPAALGGTAATATATLTPTGSVLTVDVTNAGAGYTDTPTISFGGPGTAATATANLAPTGVISKVTLSNGGGDAGYNQIPNVAVNGTGVGAVVTPIMSSTGGVKQPSLSSGGYYSVLPTITAGGGGVGASFLPGFDTAAGIALHAGNTGGTSVFPTAGGTITLAGTSGETDIVLSWSAIVGGFIQVGLTQPGLGWSQGLVNQCLAGAYGTLTVTNQADWLTPPTINIVIGYPLNSVTTSTNGSGYGTGVMGETVPLIITPAPSDIYHVNGAGTAKVAYQVTGFTITSAGNGYAPGATLTVTAQPGDFTFAEATANVFVGRSLASVTVTGGGTGYDETSTAAVIPAAGDTTGGGATVVPDIGYGVLSLVLTSPGSGYAATDTVTVSFGGTPTTPATAEAILGFPLSAIDVVTPGTGYTAGTTTVSVIPSPLDSGNTIVPAICAAVLGYPVSDISIIDPGSGYTQADPPIVTIGPPPAPHGVQATATASLQQVGDGTLTYTPGAWDLYVEIDGQTSDLIMNVTTGPVSMNTLHLPGTLQRSTEDWNLKQFTREFAVADITSAATTNFATFTCLSHGLTSGDILFFTQSLLTDAAVPQVFVAGSTRTSLKQYYVYVVDNNTFYLADTVTNLNSRNFLRFKTLQAGQTTLCYGQLLLAPENTSSYSNEGVVTLIRGRKYGFNTSNVYPTFFPADINPLTAPTPVGTEHQLGLYRANGTTNENFYSAYGETVDAGFLGEMVLRSNVTQNFYCTPLFSDSRADSEFITPSFTQGPNKIVLWGSTLTLRYTAYIPAPSNLWKFDGITAVERMDYALRGTYNNGVPEAIVLARGVDDTGELLKDSQRYHNAKGFIAYYGPYVLNEDDAYIPPSPYVAGVAIRRYRSEGYQYPPAGTKYQLNGVKEAQIPVNSTQQDILNPQGCNVLRTLPGYGYYDRQTQRYVGPVFIWGGRTRINPDDAEERLYQFVNTRVILNVVYGSLRNAFDSQIFNVIDGFGLIYNKIISIGNSVLNEIYVRGALFGATPGQAFQVICDSRINPPTSLENGIVNAKIFVTPVPTLERIQIDLIRVAIGNMQNELNFEGVGEGNQL